jgi:hypothetical protein
MKSPTFAEAVNWDYVRSNPGKVKPGPWCERIIEHARRNGYRGKITQRGASRVANRELSNK